MKTEALKNVLKGGEYLVQEEDFNSIFISDEMSEEQRMVLGMVNEYIEKEVLPHAAQIEKLDIGKTIDIQQLENGVYFLTIIAEDKTTQSVRFQVIN